MRRGGVVGRASAGAGSLFEDSGAGEVAQPRAPDAALYNEDLAPVRAAARTFGALDIAALWIGIVVCVPSYMLVGSMLELGMNCWQGLATVGVANIITLVPLVLNGHPGTAYGVPFPVLARCAFGVNGAHVPSLMRGVVAAGWFGIQTWVGGQAILTLLNALAGGGLAGRAPLPVLGVPLPDLACFAAFWAVQVAVIVRGIECIRVVERYSAPILISLCGALLFWALSTAGGLGPMITAPSQFVAGGAKAGQFWATFFPAVTANVGFWATLSLNIPDFTRFATSQRAQLMGQAVGLPFFMVAFSALALCVTSATVIIFGKPVADPVEVLARAGGVGASLFAVAGLIIATLSTNIAANVVAPANALVNLSPGSFSFKTGGVATAVLGFLIMPWKLIASSSGYIFVWLIGYSALLGPVTGIMMADYWVLRKRKLDVDGMFSAKSAGPYFYTNGYNVVALAAFAAGALPSVPGFLAAAGVLSSVPAVFATVYDYAWFMGFGIAWVTYLTGMKLRS